MKPKAVEKAWAIAAAVALSAAAPALAQESSYVPGTVWVFSHIQVEPGQYERYLDFLSGDWKRLNEFGKKEGYVVSYHVLSVSNTRPGEPDLVLAIEYKDYYPNAERLAQQKRLEAFMTRDSRKMEVESGERKVLRKILGSMELQELNLK